MLFNEHGFSAVEALEHRLAAVPAAVQTSSQTATSAGGAPGAQFGPPGVGGAPTMSPGSAGLVLALLIGAKVVPAALALYFWTKGDKKLAAAAGAAAVGAVLFL